VRINLLPKIRLICFLAFNFSYAYSQVTPLSKAVAFNDHTQAYIPRPLQDKAALDKLAALQKKTGKKPNIVWFVIDDMGYGDPGCYGGGAAVGAATPNIDRLAREGLKLTSTYSQPTCTPTRSAILTGRLPCRTGLTRPILAGDILTKNPWADEISLPEILSESGYQTVLSGKWHIGELEGMRPSEIGFDEWLGWYAAEKEISQSFDKRRYPDLVLDTFKLRAYNALGAGRDLMFGKKGEKIVTRKVTTSTDDIAEADQTIEQYSLQKIREFAKTGKPFFLEHAFMKVHADNFASKKFEGKSESKYPYKDGVVEVDAIIGDIVSELDKQGLLENTFIFITSDNGPQEDSWPDGGYTPFRGGKATAWEGGVRVPGIAYWKGTITPGRESGELFDLMDLFNTSLTIAGVANKIPADRFIDGIDQTSFLLIDDGASKRDRIHIWVERKFMAIRMYEYKMHLQYTNPEVDMMNIDYSATGQVGLAPWLFNLYIDPKERMPVGHRLNAWTAVMAAEAKGHAATFKKYPMKDVGLGQ
jgi:arylsulfatase A-like enzyme